MANSVIAQCKDVLLHKLFNTLPFEKFETAKNELFNILKNVIENGDSDSVVIEDMVHSETVPVLNDIFQEIENSEIYRGNYSIIKLDGVLQQNEKMAFKVITEHLGFNCTDLEVTGSFSDRVTFVMQSLETAHRNEAKTIIFLINRFELFCTESQTLVYNLLDASYSKQASICVIIVTRDMFCIQKFGKRASSRFSNKTILLDHINDVQKYKLMFRSILNIDMPVLEERFTNNWNKNIEDLCSNKFVTDLFEKMRIHNVNEDKIRDILALVICNIDEKPPHLTYDIIKNAAKGYLPRNELTKFSNLEMPEICVLIAIYHQLQIYDGASFNFVMIYEKLKKRKHRLKCCCLEKFRVRKAFEHIADQFLFISKEGSPEYTMYNIRYPPEHIKNFITTNLDLPDEIRNWMKDPLC